MKATEKLIDSYENYTRLIKEIELQNDALTRMIQDVTDPIERLHYYAAISKNNQAINELALKRLHMTVEVFA